MTPTPAFILRSVNYRESDRILTLLTRDLGKVSAIAKAARKSRKRFGGALEPFTRFEAVLGRGRGGGRLYSLREAHLLDSHAALARDLQRLGVAAHLLEVVREVVPEEEPNFRMFDIVQATLGLLAGGVSCPRSLGIAAIQRVLATSGFAVSVGSCNACGAPVPPGRSVLFDPLRGGVVCTPCGGGPLRISGRAAAAFAELGATSLEAASEKKLDAGEWSRIEYALDAFVQQHLEKELKTTAFRRQVAGPGERGEGTGLEDGGEHGDTEPV